MLFIILVALSIIALPISLKLHHYNKTQTAKHYWIQRDRYEELTGKPYDN